MVPSTCIELINCVNLDLLLNLSLCLRFLILKVGIKMVPFSWGWDISWDNILRYLKQSLVNMFFSISYCFCYYLFLEYLKNSLH